MSTRDNSVDRSPHLPVYQKVNIGFFFTHGVITLQLDAYSQTVVMRDLLCY